MVKRILTLVVACGVILSSVFIEPRNMLIAQDQNEDYEEKVPYEKEVEYADLWLNAHGEGKHCISNPTELKSVDGEIAAVMFEVDKDGYIVINLYNYDVLEYCYENKPNYANCDELIYNGFRQFYKTENDKLVGLVDKYVIQKTDLNSFFFQRGKN